MLNRRSRGSMILALIIAGLPTTSIAASTTGTSADASIDVLVGFDAGVPRALRDAAHATLGAQVIRHLDAIDVDLVRTPLPDAAERYEQLAGVGFAEPNRTGQLAGLPPPNDPNHPTDAWRHARANTTEAWKIWPARYYSAATKPRDAVKVAVIDGWIDRDHVDFRNKGGVSPDAAKGGQLLLSARKDIVPADRQRGALDWHGTFIAGLIGAAVNNGTDVAGVGYTSRMIPIVAADGTGAITEADAATGILHATAKGARVINLSFAIPAETQSVTLRRAVEAAGRAGAVLVAAMGNGGGRTTVYPAAFAKDHPYVIAVGATDILDAHASCSNTSPYITVGAPATNITSLRPGGGTMTAPCGTSAATAVVSGIASLIAGRFPAMEPATIKRRIALSADDIDAPGRDELSGAGRVNAQRALWPTAAPKVALSRSAPAGAANSTKLTAVITSSNGVAGAEYFVDRIGAPGAGRKLAPADGRWGEGRESAKATIVTPSLEEGLHTVWVRAKNAYGRWGPASTGALVVDRTAPAIPVLEVDPAVVVPGDGRTKLLLTVADDLSRSLRLTISFIDATDVVRARFIYLVPPAAYQADWRGTMDGPGSTSFDGPALPPGPYTVRVDVRDEAGRSTTAETTCAVTADMRT